jgi:hypothetical protein
MVTGLATGPWRSASYVSVTSAHLALAADLSWAADFPHLVICEVTPGAQAFSLISPERDRVLAAHTAGYAALTEKTLRPAVTAARDRFDAVGVRPDAVVLIGSGAGRPAVSAALAALGAPLVPCPVALVAAAIGAALAALPDPVAAEPDRGHAVKRAAAVFAAAGVLAGGLVVGGYEMTGVGRPVAATMAAAGVAAQTHTRSALALPRSGADRAGQVPGAGRIPAKPSVWGALGLRPANPGGSWRPGHTDTAGVPLRQDDATSAPATGQSPVIPAPAHSAWAPDSAGLFPGEAGPPRVGTTEFTGWFDNHWRMTLQWVVGMSPHA